MLITKEKQIKIDQILQLCKEVDVGLVYGFNITGNIKLEPLNNLGGIIYNNTFNIAVSKCNFK